MMYNLTFPIVIKGMGQPSREARSHVCLGSPTILGPGARLPSSHQLGPLPLRREGFSPARVGAPSHYIGKASPKHKIGMGASPAP